MLTSTEETQRTLSEGAFRKIKGAQAYKTRMKRDGFLMGGSGS
jgi:hypothetical protein